MLEDVVRKEQERLDGIRKKELARIIHERRRENKQRQTQEIKFNWLNRCEPPGQTGPGTQRQHLARSWGGGGARFLQIQSTNQLSWS